jgi:hypothetical protein
VLSFFPIRDCHGRKMISFFLDMIAMNEIKENNYDMNILWKGNITCMWALKNDVVSMIVGDSDFSLP